MKIFLKKNYITINKKQKIKNTNVYKSFYNIIAFIFLNIGTYLYLKSLKGCDGDEFSCINYSIQYIYDDIYYCTNSALYFILFLFIFYYF